MSCIIRIRLFPYSNWHLLSIVYELVRVKTPLAEGNRIQYNFVKPHGFRGKDTSSGSGVECHRMERPAKASHI